MADRNQDYIYRQGARRQRQDWRDEEDYMRRDPYRSRGVRGDEGRYYGGDDDFEHERSGYGPYVDSDEGESSVRAGSFDQGRVQYGRRRDTGGQSGSTGRYAGYGEFGQGDYSRGRSSYSGQGKYGQTGYGQGGYGQGSQGEPRYGYEQRPDYEREYYARQRGSGRYSQGTFGTERSGAYESYGADRQGMHRGKGPKGYQRSDERLKEMLCERLRDDPDIDPSEVTVNVQGGKITLEGTVDSRWAKNAIEDVADQFGVQDVQNNLRVQRQSQQGSEGATRGSGAGKGAGSDESGATRTKQH